MSTELTISLNIKLHHIPLLLKATAVFHRFLNKLQTCFVGRHKCHPFSAIWLHLTPLSVPLNTPIKQVFQCSSVWGSLQRLLLPFWSLFKAGVPASHKSLSCSELSSSPGKKQARPTACRRWGSGNQQKCWPSGHRYCLGVRNEPLVLGSYISCRHPRNHSRLSCEPQAFSSSAVLRVPWTHTASSGWSSPPLIYSLTHLLFTNYLIRRIPRGNHLS